MRLKNLGSLLLTLHLMVVCAMNMPGAMRFTDVTDSANIDHKHSHDEDLASIDFELSVITGGAVAEDFNGDGWIDLYVLKGGDAPDLLYINQQDGTFQNEAEARGAALVGVHMGACAADYDSDGDVDIFVSGASAPHHLLINDGSGFFTVDSTMINMPVEGVSSPSMGDLNNDGLLELSLGAWGNKFTVDPERRLQFYKNTGAGQLDPYFSLPNERDFLQCFLDMDGDHWQDLLAVGDFENARWYRNNGKGLLLEAGRNDIINPMGAAIGDIDNDGDLDMFMSAIASLNPESEDLSRSGNRLLLNNGHGDFTDATESSGVRDGDWGWGAEMADFDNDGDLDIYHVNGWPLGANVFIDTPAKLFENHGDNAFSEIAGLSGDAAQMGQGRCVVVFDYDNDGDQDIFIANNSDLEETGSTSPDNPFGFIFKPAAPVLLRNDSENDHHFLKVGLNGLASPHHSQGIGSRIHVKTGEVEQMRELNASSGFNGHGPERLAHFGLGEHDTIDRIRVVWTTGDTVEVRNVVADQVITLTSPIGQLSQRDILSGDSVSAVYPEDEIPDGAIAIWTINGVENPDPAEVVLHDPGEYEFQVVVTSNDGSNGFIRSETFPVTVLSPEAVNRSIAQIWNEMNLDAIRMDFPDPTVHARNLFATSVAMWDAWAAYDPIAVGVLHNESAIADDLTAARHEAISHAAFRVLSERYSESVNGPVTSILLSDQMVELGFDPMDTSISGDSPSALGNRIAESVLSFMATDGSNDGDSFLDTYYEAVNEPLLVTGTGTSIEYPNHWQPLEFDQAFTQNQQTADLIQSFLGPHWGGVRPFALSTLSAGELLHLDPGSPPLLGSETDQEFKAGSLAVVEFSSLLDPDDHNMIDISPGSLGNNTLGMNDGTGYTMNPVSGEPYSPNVVNHADFGRVLAEFWADGPDSETPPGHWNTLANSLHEYPGFERNFQGIGPEMDRLQWDVKVYLAMNGALHDAAIAAWGCKRVYDYVRPISSIRYMGGLGQSTEPQSPSYHVDGLPLVPNLVEIVTADSSSPGQRHEHLVDHIGSIAIRAWSEGQEQTPGGVDWMLAEDWLPYQRDTFVTPAFPGYVSGHSTFSRAAAEVLARITGSPFFPGGMGTFTARQNEYLEFETGPATDVVLQWATYFDASDQAGISRLYGGIHVPADDGPGRVIGSLVGIHSWELASKYFDGRILTEPISTQVTMDNLMDFQFEWSAIRGARYKLQQLDSADAAGYTDLTDWFQATETTESILLPSNADGLYRIMRSHDTP